MSKIPISLMVGARTFMRAAKKRTMLAIYTTPTSKLAPKSNGLPIQYEEFQDVFEKKYADTLPQRRPHECAIELQEGAQPSFRPIYSLLQNKLTMLQEYIEKNLAKNFTRHSKSLAKAPMLFVKKKDGLL